jgi:hypothetical protein
MRSPKNISRITSKLEILKNAVSFFTGKYSVTRSGVAPLSGSIKPGKVGTVVDVAILTILNHPSAIECGLHANIQRAKISKCLMHGISDLCRNNEGELRSYSEHETVAIFGGPERLTNAVVAALQVEWFINRVLIPSICPSSPPDPSVFKYGIGVDSGEILAVGLTVPTLKSSTLLWIGSALTRSRNLALKSDKSYRLRISSQVYLKMGASALRPIIVRAAPSFILCHNHPSGVPSPSRADEAVTRRIREASVIFQIDLVDHVIIGRPLLGRSPYYSFQETGAL